MKKYSFLLIIQFVFAPFLMGQQELGLHFMRKVWQSTYTNPAFFSDSKVTVALPSTYLNYTNSTFNQSDIITKQGDSSVIDLNAIVSRMKEDNFVAMHGQVDPLAVGIRVKNFQISLTSGVKTFAGFGYNKDMIGLLAQGNEAYIGKTVNLAPTINVNVYSEIGLGLAYRFLKDGKLSVGGRVKYLMGMGDVSTSKQHKEISLYTDPDFYQLNFKTDYQLQSSNIMGGNLDSVYFTTNNLKAITKNNGIGLDFGVNYKVTDALTLSASVIDMGSIKWTENAKTYTSNGSFLYDGVHFQDIVENKNKIDFVKITGTLRKTFGFKGLETGSYKTALPTRFYLSGSYQIIKLIRVGALFYGESLNNKFNPGVALSGNLELRRWFSCGLLVGYRNQRIGNVGLNLSVKGGGFQWFFATDNVGGLIIPGKTRNFNMRTGLNIAIGKADE